MDSVYKNTCLHTSLSNQFDFETYIERYHNDYFDSCIVKIAPINKSNKKRGKEINIKSSYYFSEVLMNCENVRSYSTNVNDTLIALDNDYGDLIIADFNFDNKDDFAIKRNSGGNGGPEYDYFLQSSNNNFIKNSYLSDSLVFFPSEISKEKKCLMTLVHAGVCHMGKHIYHYDSMNKT